MTDLKKSSTAEALREWREAERGAAVARRGKLAAEAAVTAAEEAAIAAADTAVAAKSSLQAATLAEASASKTAGAARLLVQHAQAGLVDADVESAMAEADEIEARTDYKRVADGLREGDSSTL